MKPYADLVDRNARALRLTAPLAAALWIASEFTLVLGVSPVWAVPFVALALAAVGRTTPWRAVALTPALALTCGLRVSMGLNPMDLVGVFVVLLCAELPVALLSVWVGDRIDAAVERRRAHAAEPPGRAMGVATIVGVALAGLCLAVTLSRFPERVEVPLGARLRGSNDVVVGVFQPLGSRCPTRCDQLPSGTRGDAESLLAPQVTNELVPGASLTRDRVGAMTTRARLMVTPPGHAPRSVFDRPLAPGQALHVTRDAAGRFLSIDYAQHPRLTVRLSNGETFTEYDRSAARVTPYHAPVAYVLTALAGIALAAWLLVVARRERSKTIDTSAWRDATVEDDGMVHFETELPPAPLPVGASPALGRVVVTRVTAPVGAGYRSDGVVVIHEMFRGTRDALVAELVGRAATLERSGFVCVVVSLAPLAGAWAFGDAW
jgi:hypothetical protein